MLRTAALAGTAFCVAVLLQGCGGGGDPSIATSTTAGQSTVTVTTVTTTPKPTPAPFLPIQSICYKSMPVKHLPDTPLPGEDTMQIGYQNQWGKEGRDDLAIMKAMGATSVRIYKGLGIESETDHSAFLDHAQALGINVIVGFETQNVCPDFDCYKTWKDAVGSSARVGLVKNNTWHPAVKMITVVNAPDNLNFWEAAGVPTDCAKSPTCKGDEAKCRVKASVSALDGLLAAEKELGIDDSSVSLTFAWTFNVKDSITGHNQIEYFGFLDTEAGIADPSMAHYECKAGDAGLKLMKDAYGKRWVHSVNTGASWKYTFEKIAHYYDSKPVAPRPWFVSEFAYTGDDPTEQIQASIEGMRSEAAKGEHFIGVSFSEFQHDYIQTLQTGLFGLGDQTLGKVTPCTEDVFVKDKQCYDFDVYCLDPKEGDGGRAGILAGVWGGKVEGAGICKKEHVLDIVF